MPLFARFRLSSAPTECSPSLTTPSLTGRQGLFLSPWNACTVHPAEACRQLFQKFIDQVIRLARTR